MVPLPPWLRLWLPEKNEKERAVLSWWSIFQTKTRNNARQLGTADFRRKAILSVLDATFGYYQLDCPSNRNYLLKLYTPMLDKSARTVYREFYLENVSKLGLLHMVSWGCCDNTFLCKTCFHAVYHQSKRIKTVLCFSWKMTT